MIASMPSTGRPQQRYDHRLRHLVQRTGDVTGATDLGGCASDICLRDVVVNAEIRKEISRLARPGCRLTVAQNSLVETNLNRTFLLSLGGVLEDAFIFNDSADGIDHQVLVIAMRGDGR